MKCIDFEGSNITLKGDGKDVYDIRAAQFKTPAGGRAFLTIWELEPADIKHILQAIEAGNAPAVQLYVIGSGFPPVALKLCTMAAKSSAAPAVVPLAESTTISNIPPEKHSDQPASRPEASDDQTTPPASRPQSFRCGDLQETDPLADIGERLGLQRKQGIPGPGNPPSQG